MTLKSDAPRLCAVLPAPTFVLSFQSNAQLPMHPIEEIRAFKS